MFRHLFILILLFSLHSNASNEILQTKDFGNLTITETNNQVMVTYKNQTVLELDYLSCALCGGVYVIHSKHRDDVKWIESGHPLLDEEHKHLRRVRNSNNLFRGRFDFYRQPLLGC